MSPLFNIYNHYALLMQIVFCITHTIQLVRLQICADSRILIIFLALSKNSTEFRHATFGKAVQMATLQINPKYNLDDSATYIGFSSRRKNMQATLVASNASVKHMHESPHFHHHGSGSFLLVEAPPQSPQDTILYPGTAAKMQRLRDFSNRLWTLNVLLFRILSPWYAYPPPEFCPHLPWQFAENASHLWSFDSLHTWLFSRTKAERISLASS